MTYGSNEILSILSPKGSNFDGASVAQYLRSQDLAAFDSLHAEKPKFWRLWRSGDFSPISRRGRVALPQTETKPEPTDPGENEIDA